MSHSYWQKALWKYLRGDKRQVNGWLQRVDAEIIGAILEFQSQQGIAGGCVEIGVHHGKSFVPLCLALREEELALCIDIFDDQSQNLDASGAGNFKSFQETLARFRIDPHRVRVIKGSSASVSHDEIIRQIGTVRFFSIDGGHWSAIVQNDLRLAEATLAPDGVIALDDYCRADWPEVTAAHTLWQAATESDIIPFAVGSNKLFLCRKNFAGAYKAILKTPFLVNYFSKSYGMGDAALDSYRIEPFEQDETPAKRVLALTLSIFRPDLFVALKDTFRRHTN